MKPRNIGAVIAQIQATLPTVPDPAIAAQIMTLQAELTLQARYAAYTAPEGTGTPWDKLSLSLYRYMPVSGNYPWVAQVQQIMQGTASS